MNVSSLIPSLSDLPGFGRSATAAGTSAAANVAADGSAIPGASAAMRQIVSRYDMSDISPNDFSQMVQKLYNNGAISQKDLQNLSGIRADLDKAGVPADTSINLVDFYRNQLQAVSAPANGKPANPTDVQSVVGRLSWIEKFSAVQNQPASVGVNTTA
jgi:hypothetical protein